MPEFLIEVTSKTTYGPYTFPDAGAVRQAIVSGNLQMDQLTFEANAPSVFQVKAVRVKDEE